MLRIVSVCALLCALPSCLDLKPDAAPVVRYMTVGQAAARTGPELASPQTRELRIGRVNGSAGIDDRLMRRSSAFEVIYDDQIRWVEAPAIALQHALDEELFRRRGFIRDERAERRLDVELVQFEESMSPRHEAVVAVIVQLIDGNGVALLERRIEGREVINGDDPVLTTQALSASLMGVVAELSDLIAVR